MGTVHLIYSGSLNVLQDCVREELKVMNSNIPTMEIMDCSDRGKV